MSGSKVVLQFTLSRDVTVGVAERARKFTETVLRAAFHDKELSVSIVDDVAEMAIAASHPSVTKLSSVVEVIPGSTPFGGQGQMIGRGPFGVRSVKDIWYGDQKYGPEGGVRD